MDMDIHLLTCIWCQSQNSGAVKTKIMSWTFQRRPNSNPWVYGSVILLVQLKATLGHPDMCHSHMFYDNIPSVGKFMSIHSVLDPTSLTYDK